MKKFFLLFIGGLLGGLGLSLSYLLADTQWMLCILSGGIIGHAWMIPDLKEFRYQNCDYCEGEMLENRCKSCGVFR